MAIEKKANPVAAYLSGVGDEFKKITWPGKDELVDSSIVVITFIVILAVVVFCFDKFIMFFLDLILR